MDQKNYGKPTWIVTIILAILSIVMDVLILTDVWAPGNEMMKQSAVLMLIVAGYILFMSVKALIAKCKEEKEGKE